MPLVEFQSRFGTEEACLDWLVRTRWPDGPTCKRCGSVNNYFRQNPAYTSQCCSNPACGYVDSRNRREQARFRCLWCGSRMSADVNAGRNVGERRSSPEATPVGHTKSAALAELVRRFNERWPRPRSQGPGRNGRRGPTADPRWSNPYFRDWAAAARSSLDSDAGAPANDPEKLLRTQALVA